MLEQANKAWHGVKLSPAGLGRWIRTAWRSAAELRGEGLLFHFILNAYWEPLDFELPKLDVAVRGGAGSTRPSIRRNDIVPWQTAPTISGARYPPRLARW